MKSSDLREAIAAGEQSPGPSCCDLPMLLNETRGAFGCWECLDCGNTLPRLDAAGTMREGAGEPHAWFCYLGLKYVPGSKTQHDDIVLAGCGRCGVVMPRDEKRWRRACHGHVTIELRAGGAR